MHYSTVNLIKLWLNIFNILLGTILIISIFYWIFISEPQKKLYQEQSHQYIEIIIPENNLLSPDDSPGSDNYV